MSDRPQDRTPTPPAREWLPDALPPADSPLWDAPVVRILAAAEAELRLLGSAGVAASSPSTWTLLGRWWKPAAALAAAAAASLVFVDRAPAPASADGSLSLSVLATDGDPRALWGAEQAAPHPVLALVAAEPDTEEDR